MKTKLLLSAFIFFCVQVPSFAINLFVLNQAAVEKENLGGQHMGDFTLGQYWKETGADAVPSAAISLYQTEDGIRVIATLEDMEIFNKGTAMNQKLWRMGDVLEIFIGIPGQPEYLELHIAPTNHKLQMRWTTERLAGFRSGALPFDVSLIADPAFFTARTEVYAEQNYWQVFAFIPFQSIGVVPDGSDLLIQMVFARYDATLGQRSVQTGSARFSELNFHERSEWHVVNLR